MAAVRIQTMHRARIIHNKHQTICHRHGGDTLIQSIVRPDLGLLRLGEIDALHAGAVILGEQAEIVGQERVALLSPQRVDDVQPEALLVFALGALAALRQLLGQRLEGGVELGLWQPEMERLGHLLFGLTPRAGVGHGQRRRDAVG